MSRTAPSPPRWTPDLEDAEEFTYFVRLDADSQIYVRQMVLRGQVVAFAVMQQRLLHGGWVDVVRVDSCHGEVHVHRWGRSGQELHREVIRPIAGQEDVDYGLDVALEIVEGHWEENLRRWDLGR